MDATLPPSPFISPDRGSRAAEVRVVIVLDEALTIGYAANAAAVLALTLGSLAPELPGRDPVDADGCRHPGLIPFGPPILKSASGELKVVRDRALALGGVTVVDFPVHGQRTNDYETFCALVAATPAAAMQYLGIALYGPRRAINKLVGNLSLLR